MNEPKKNDGQPVTEPEQPKLKLNDEELQLLGEGELVDVDGGRIGFPPCAN